MERRVLQVLPLIRFINEDHMIVPDDQFLLVPAGLLSPERNHSLLVADEHDPALGQLLGTVVAHPATYLPHVLLAVAGSITAL